ncbi:MAG: sulfatase-like hydrolase/transferase [Leptolyngbyaceae cyanobacterium bins.302]|nr:sulfatase-like hydrolase/transferase [Leptolyngbyaceae cyanobacterium bins.302]
MKKAIIAVAAIALLLLSTLLPKVNAQPMPFVGAQAAPTTSPTQPARIIFFHIDGLHYQAPERLKLTNYQALEQQGTSVGEAYILIPWHQTENGYRSLSLTSPPNPTTLAGTLFLDPWWEERYIQHAFYPTGLTAHIANSTAYETLNPGMHFVKLNRGNDEENIRYAIDLLQNNDIKFMRLVLQDTGSASQRVADGRLKNQPWAENIWADGSPYIKAAQNADRLLGEFVAALKRLGQWDDTLLVLLSDGQASTGWHPIQNEESWRIPLAFIGPGIARGKTIPYAESIDIVPTVLNLMGMPPLNTDGGAGRVLEEIKVGSGDVQVPRRLLELNRQIKEHLRLRAQMQLLADRYPLIDTSLMEAENRLIRPNAIFYNLERMDQWREAGTIDNMLKVNRAAIAFLKERLQQSGALINKRSSFGSG